jgi:hypothetical protein
MFLRVGAGKNRVGAVVALAAVLAMVLAAPAVAAPWGGFGEAREITTGFLPRALVWLGLSPIPSTVLKCDDGSQIDPNGGCHKASGASVSGTGGMRAGAGSRVPPGHGR